MGDPAVTVPIDVGGAGRPYPGESASGDGWRVDRVGGACRIALIDGLGHGPQAAAAATAALAVLAAAPGLDPVAAVGRCHEVLRGTRGAAMLLAGIDAGAGRLVVVGVGNVEARLGQGGRWQRIVTDRGIVGATVPRLHPLELDLAAGWTLVLHTDGVSSRLDPDAVAASGADPAAMAAAILDRWGRTTDDATVVVARLASSAG